MLAIDLRTLLEVITFPINWEGFSDRSHPRNWSLSSKIGIATGALFAGPIAESPIYIFSRCIHLAFILGPALAPNVGAQLACRSLAGLGASIILAIRAASMADVSAAHGRSLAWPFVVAGSFFGVVQKPRCFFFSVDSSKGATFSPIVGGWIAQSSISWRWRDWIIFILYGATLIITFLFLPELFAPNLLS